GLGSIITLNGADLVATSIHIAAGDSVTATDQMRVEVVTSTGDIVNDGNISGHEVHLFSSAGNIVHNGSINTHNSVGPGLTNFVVLGDGNIHLNGDVTSESAISIITQNGDVTWSGGTLDARLGLQLGD